MLKDVLPSTRIQRRMSVYESTTKRYVRWPFVALVMIIIWVELSFYFVVRSIVVVYECIRGKILPRAKRKTERLFTAASYTEWNTIARQLDEDPKRKAWKAEAKSPFYDYKLTQTTVEQLRQYRTNNELTKLIDLLSIIFEKRIDAYGINNEDLYSRTFVGTKNLIHEFIDEVVESTEFVQTSSLPTDVKLKFFKKAKKDFGQVALCLSGGGSLGLYHYGVVKALFDANLLPKIISGASAGSMVASWICVRTDEEIKENLNPKIYTDLDFSGGGFWSRCYRLFRTGYLFSEHDWRRRVKLLTKGNTTFEEAYRRTSRILNIQITSGQNTNQPIILNYKTAPRVVVWSAVLASGSIPNLIPPIELKAKNEHGRIVPYHRFGKSFNDGSIKNDIPLTYLKERLNVTYSIVSQTNPHVLPFVYSSRGSCGDPNTHRGGVGLRGGFLLSTIEKYLKLEMRKWVVLLSELELFPRIHGQPIHHMFLQEYEGSVTIFARPWLRDYFKFMSKQTHGDLKRFIARGGRFCYPKITMISNHMKFFEVISRCSRCITRIQLVEHNTFI